MSAHKQITGVHVPTIKTTKLHHSVSLEKHVKGVVKAFKGRKIGSGAFAIVYRSLMPSKANVVMKVGYCNKIDKDAYFDYLKQIILKQPSNSLVPRIHSVEVFKGKDRYDDWSYAYVVVMERLIKYFNVSNKVASSSLSRYGLTSTYDLMLNGKGDKALKQLVRKDQTGDLKPILRPLKRLMCKHGEDLHHGNVMWRATGHKRVPYQLVITDPVA